MDPNQTSSTPNPLSAPVQSVTPDPTLQPEQNIPDPTPPGAPKKMPKFVGILLLIVLIVVLGGGTVVMNMMKKSEPKKELAQVKPSPTKKPTPTITATSEKVPSDWKTYSGKLYTFRYPPSWTDDTSEQQFMETGILVRSIDITGPEYTNLSKGAFIYRFFETDIFEAKPDVTLQSIFDGLHDGPTYKADTVISKSDITLDGQPAKKLVYLHENTGNVQVAFSYPHNKGFSWIGFVAPKNDFTSYQKIFDQILSSFTFTYQKQEIDTSDWKTYTDSSSQISFKYPPKLEVMVQNIARPQNAPVKIIELKGYDMAPFIGFYYYENGDNLSLADLDKKLTVTDNYRGAWSPNLSLANTPITIGNTPAYHANGSILCTPAECDRYIIQKENKVFVILIYRSGKSEDPIGQQILSTFKFIQ